MQKQNTNAKQSTVPARRVVRLGRLIAVIRTVITVIVILAIAITALATLDNTLAPSVQLAHAVDGPAALSVVRTFEYDPKTNTLYAGSNAGVFKSTDDGVNWLPAGNGLPGVDIQDLLIDHETGNLYTVVFGVGLFRSEDGAQSWQDISGDFRGSAVLTVGIDQQTGVMYAGLVGYGLYTSTDKGDHWETIGMGVLNMIPRALLAGPQPGEVFVASDTGIYHSTQVTGTWDTLAGETGAVSSWALARDPKTSAVYAGTDQGVLKLTPNQNQSQSTYLANLTGLTGPQAHAVAFDEQTGVLYAGTTSGVYRSTDDAATWTQANQGLGSTLVHALFIKSQSDELFAGTDSGVFRSADGGSSWQPAAVSPSARHGQAILVNQPDNTLYAGTLGGGVFRSTDGGAKWEPINTGLRTTVVQALGIDHDTGTLFAGTRGGIYRSPVNSINWTLASPKLAGQDVVQLAVDERRGNVYAVNTNGDVLRSSNAGAEWNVIQRLQRVFARTVAVSYYSSAIYVGAYRGGVMMSRDGGFNWFPAGTLPGDRNVEALAVDERDGTLYVGTLGGALYRMTALTPSVTWTKLGENLPSNIVALAVDEKSGACFAAVKEGLYRLGPDDTDWRLAGKGMGHTDMMALATHRADGILYAGVMAGGVYRSTDSGANWQQGSDGLTDIDMRSIATDASGTLFANTTGRGVYQIDPDLKTWRVVNAGLKDLSSTVGLAGNAAGGLDVTTLQGAYETSDASAGWQPSRGWLADLSGWIAPVNAFGFVGRLPSGDLLWASRGGGATWASASTSLGLVNATIRQLPNGQGQVYAAWGAELTRTDPGAGYGRVPLAWLYTRAWIWTTFARLNLVAPWWWAVVVGVVVLGLILWLLGRVRLNRGYGVPLKTALFNPAKSVQAARTRALEHAWPRWERAIQGELFAYGEVRPIDLLGVPGPFRLYAMRRFADVYGKQQAVEFKDNRLLSRAREHIRQWVDAWQAMRIDLRRDGIHWQNRKHVDELARSFASVLELQTLPPKDNDSVRAYALQPAASQVSGEVSGDISPAPKLALLFVADNEALKRTTQNIVDALDGLNVPGAQGLVISLGRPGRNVDVTSQIQLAVADLDEAQRARLRVLSNDDVMRIMAAADPAQALASPHHR